MVFLPGYVLVSASKARKSGSENPFLTLQLHGIDQLIGPDRMTA